MAFDKKWLNWLLYEDRRKNARQEPVPPLLAFYWDGANPVPHAVRDASPAGMYLLTEHRWYPGTILALTLQRSGARDDEPDRSISVNARVVWSGVDGVAFEFLLAERSNGGLPDAALPTQPVRGKQLKHFLDRVRVGGEKGHEHLKSF